MQIPSLQSDNVHLLVTSTDWDARVHTIRVVCHNMGRIGDTKMIRNHWSIFLLLDDDKSVRLNMTADYGCKTKPISIWP